MELTEVDRELVERIDMISGRCAGGLKQIEGNGTRNIHAAAVIECHAQKSTHIIAAVRGRVFGHHEQQFAARRIRADETADNVPRTDAQRAARCTVVVNGQADIQVLDYVLRVAPGVRGHEAEEAHEYGCDCISHDSNVS